MAVAATRPAFAAPRARRAALRQRQRGAAAVFAAIAIIGGLIAVGLAIDLGRLYYTQRDLQRLANMAALDSARVAGGCLGPVGDPALAALAEARDSVVRNGGEIAWVQEGTTVGEMDINGGERRFVATAAPADLGRRAVEVQLARPAPARLIPGLSSAAVPQLRARAAALSSPRATLHVGSRLAGVSNNAPLNALYSSLFGAPFNLSLAGYQGLINSTLPLQDLLDELGLGDANQPLDESVPVETLLGAIGELAGVPELENVVVAGDVVVGEALGIDRPVDGAQFNAAQLLTAIGEARANQDQAFPLELPILLPGLTDTVATIISPGLPVALAPGGIALDPANFASNTQVRLSTELQLPPVLGLVLNADPLVFEVEAVRAEAEVDGIRCARRGDAETIVDRVDVSAESYAAALRIPPAEIIDVNLLGIGRIEVTLSAQVQIPAASDTWENLAAGDRRQLATNSLGLQASALNIQVCVKPLLLPRICGPSAAALLPAGFINALSSAVLAPVNSLIAPVLAGLGVNVAGADITVVAIDAHEPLLFTH